VISIQLEGSLSALGAIIENLKRLPERRAAALASIMREGVLDNYDRLAWGGAVMAADGTSILWSRRRNAMTIAIRRSRGLGALFPILTLTGKLRSGIARGHASTYGSTAYYEVGADVRQLVRVHQLGLAPLPNGRRGGRPAGFNVPERPIVFWSRDMAKQVRVLAEAEVKT
jgi:hypothetical protein